MRRDGERRRKINSGAYGGRVINSRAQRGDERGDAEGQTEPVNPSSAAGGEEDGRDGLLHRFTRWHADDFNC